MPIVFGVTHMLPNLEDTVIDISKSATQPLIRTSSFILVLRIALVIVA